MPLISIVVVVCLFAMFGSFIVVLGGVNLWMAVLERRDAAAAARTAARETEMRLAA
ncbi:hypothetical protein [Phenylobacterium sp.]|uniref:hypothetical protein n=1 Tax=Phenylobacterium sp. TaxID=1871053 RepID=UPI0025E051B4|nr:hypothetical protein [Phenylobacterium sp.]